MSKPISQQATVHIEETASRAATFLRSRYGLWSVVFISFIESALIVPVVTDPVLVAYILAERAKAVQAVFATTAASVVGGMAAYFMALGFYEFLVTTMLSPGLVTELTSMTHLLEDGVFVLTLIGAFTPIPYTIVALAVGFAGANFWLFLLASLIGRGLRYTIVGWVTYRFGDHALAIARRQILLVTIIGIVLGALLVWLKLTL
ncbi:MAG: VTT domain-containing protein [Patescibacteria group bacterium]